jgi:amidase/6-aminohexanoate-cyclic-dimer hydrolase
MTRFKEFGDHDALGLAELVRKRQVSASELLDEAIARLEAVEPRINAVPVRHEQFARQQIAGGLPDGAFAGVPFLLKNLALLAGTPTTYGSRAYKDYVADRSSTLVERHLQAGFVIFGKTASPEFGLNLSTEPVLHGPTRNPWRLEHSSGGSSGGAAAVVAARVLPIAHASDGGGSIRVPSACCGVFGLKPTRARTPLGPDRLEGWAGLSCAHAVSISVRDSAALLDATHGPEVGSPHHAPAPERPFLDEVKREPGRLRIGFSDRHPDGSAIDPEVAAATREIAALLELLGHRVEQKAPRLTGDLGATMRAIISANTALTLNERAGELGRPLTRDDLEFATFALYGIGAKTSAPDYIAATGLAQQIGRQLALALAEFDVFLTPTLSLPPLPLGKLDTMSQNLEAYGRLIGRYSPMASLFNMSGQPSMSVPLAWSKDGLPLGMMFTGRFGDEATLFRLAAQLEQARPWRIRKPPVCA